MAHAPHPHARKPGTHAKHHRSRPHAKHRRGRHPHGHHPGAAAHGPKRRPATLAPAARQPLPSSPAPAPVGAPAPPPDPSNAPVPTFTESPSVAHMERLLWRAGFGPSPGQAQALAQGSIQRAVLGLTRPNGPASLVGPTPHDENGRPLAPADAWGHDHCFWLDRMVRSDQPLVERMALLWHDWFATSNEGVNKQQLMLDQTDTFRQLGLGSFDDLFLAVTRDPAMLTWLNGTSNSVWEPNENYAREMMELFSLGAERGAYTEGDVRQMARALTGWRSDWTAELGEHNFRYDPTWHDSAAKTVFGQTGAFDWTDAVRLCVGHPLHASFFVTKLWGYFVPTPPDQTTLASLQGLYNSSGHSIRAVVEAILQHPALYDGAEMVSQPVVYNAGLLRARGRGIDTTAWTWQGATAGQQLYYPPNVAGWDFSRWLDTSTVRGRWQLANSVAMTSVENPWPNTGGYDATEDAATAVGRAMAYWGNPAISTASQNVIAAFRSSSTSGRDGRLAAVALPRHAPERPAHAHRHQRRHVGSVRNLPRQQPPSATSTFPTSDSS